MSAQHIGCIGPTTYIPQVELISVFFLMPLLEGRARRKSKDLCAFVKAPVECIVGDFQHQALAGVHA